MSDAERAITETEAATMLAMSVKTLRAWRCKGRGPRFVKFGRAVRYLPSDMDEYVRKNTVSTTMSDVLCGTV